MYCNCLSCVATVNGTGLRCVWAGRRGIFELANLEGEDYTEKIDGDYCNSCRNFNFLPEITTEKFRRSNL